MHIMEGFLPWYWCAFWFLCATPFVIWGIVSVRKTFREHPEQKIMVAVAGAFIFLLSSLKLPSVTGSSSHPTGTGFSTIYYGVGITTVLSSIVLVFQAILLAHGGLTTLGANIFSMGVAGPAMAFGVFVLMARLDLPRWACVFVAAALANLGTYVVTSFQLALAYPGENFISSFETFLGVFAVTQIPLAIVEGVLFVMFVDYLSQSRPDLLGPLAKLRSKKGAAREKEAESA